MDAASLHSCGPCSHSRQRRALILALALTSAVMIVEFVGGWIANSLALMADAGHMLADSAALGLSLFALWFSSRPATARMTYGFLRVEILSALINGVALVVISLLIFYEAYRRMLAPPEVRGGMMLAIACGGLAVNLVCALLLLRSHLDNLNVKGAFLHVVGDALGSLGAITAGILMVAWNWYLADPLTSFLAAALILYNAWRLVKESADILMEGTPGHIDLEAVRASLCQVAGVESIHDLHIWTLTSGVHAMSCHAVMCGSQDRHQTLEQLSQILRNQFSIDHTTIQMEEFSLQHQERNSCH